MATAALATAAAAPTFKFHAIRKCDVLKAPAIFLDYDDCSFYVDQNENDDAVEYKSFNAITEALDYICNVSQKAPITTAETQHALMPPRPAAGQASLNGSLVPILPKPTTTGVAASAPPVTATTPVPAPVVRAPLIPTIPAFPTTQPPQAQNSLPATATAPAVPLAASIQTIPPFTTTQQGTVQNALTATAPAPTIAAGASIPMIPPLTATQPAAVPATAPAPTVPLAASIPTIQPAAAPNASAETRIPNVFPRKRGRPVGGTNKNKGVPTQEGKEKFKAQVALLQQHFEKHGTFDFLVAEATDKKLRRFATEMRRSILQDKLRPDQYERLEAIGFVEDVKKHGTENSFDRKAMRLKEYFDQHGTFTVTDSKQNPLLRTFVQNMLPEIRRYRVNPKNSTLTAEQFQTLESIGLVDEAKGTIRFADRIKELKEYQVQHGHLDVDTMSAEEFPELASFTKRMRREIRKYQKKTPGHVLDAQQYQQLESIGLVQQVAKNDDPTLTTKEKKEREWESRFEEVKLFKNRNGRLPQKNTSDDQKLANWVATQKSLVSKAVKKGADIKISAHQVACLGAMGISSETQFYKSFDERVQEWIDYKEQNGGKNPPGISDLGYWARRTKQRYKEFKLGNKSVVTQETVDKLSAAGFVFPTDEEVEAYRTRQPAPKRLTWEQRFQDLAEYKRLYGHTSVPQKAGTHGSWLRQLGSWVHDQRMEYKRFKNGKKSSMNPERLGKLMEIGFSFSATIGRGSNRPNNRDEESEEEDHQYY